MIRIEKEAYVYAGLYIHRPFLLYRKVHPIEQVIHE